MSHQLDGLFKPRSVAVVGASREKGSVGWQILHNLVTHEFQGKVFPVNPKADVIHSMKAYANVLEITDPIDLAVIVVPARHVESVLLDCGRKGVKGAVIISAGFREMGGEGAAREARVLAIAREYGIRVVGPNCMGLLNTHPDIRLDATFAPVFPGRGKVAFLSQSGAMGVAILNLATELDLGLSYFVSMGNKTDLSSNDLLEYWEHDPDVDVILMYLESFGNPRHFPAIARRVARKKPVIAVKSGRTTAGARAAISHTGALAGADVAVDALFDQCGVIRVDGVMEMFDVARCFVGAPAPKGDRVAIVSNAGGPAILATDACVGHGLRIAELAPATKRRLREGLVAEASVENPIDMVAGAGPRDYRHATEAVLADRGVDAVIVIDVPPVAHDTAAVVRGVIQAIRGGDKPVLGCLMAPTEAQDAIRRASRGRLPFYPFPEGAARALARVVRYHRRRAEPVGRMPRARVDRDAALAVIETVRGEGRTELRLDEAFRVAVAYGIPVARFELARSAREAAAAARAIGFPVAMKLVAEGVSHKTELGGVAVGVTSERDAEATFRSLRDRVDAEAFAGVVVQEMVAGARETIVGMSQDATFGPLMMFGLGGIYVEVLRDVAFGVHPITDREADAMIRSIRAYPLLEGVRGEARADHRALRDVLLRASRLVGDLHEITELELNPFMVAPEGGRSLAVDARMCLGPVG